MEPTQWEKLLFLYSALLAVITYEALTICFKDMGKKIPGFGNSFFKDSIDPAWFNVESLLQDRFPKVSARIEELGGFVTASIGTKLYPNAAMFTAAACSELGVVRGFESALFIIARIPAWGGLCRG